MSQELKIQEVEELQRIEDAGKGVSRQRRKQIEIEESLESLTRYLDGLFRIPGTTWRFGLDALIGLIPNVGDVSTALLSFYILIAGVRYGVPKITLLRMAFNIGLDYVIGIVPFIGDIFDFFWRANQQNMDLIRKHGEGKGTGTAGDWVFVIVTISMLIGLLAASIFLSVFVVWAAIGWLIAWLSV